VSGHFAWAFVIALRTFDHYSVPVRAVWLGIAFSSVFLRPGDRFCVACVSRKSNECGVRKTPWPTTRTYCLINPQINCAAWERAVAEHMHATAGPVAGGCRHHHKLSRYRRRPGKRPPKPSRCWRHSFLGSALRYGASRPIRGAVAPLIAFRVPSPLTGHAGKARRVIWLRFAIVGSMRRRRTCADEHVCRPSKAAVPVCRAARQHAEPAMRLHRSCGSISSCQHPNETPARKRFTENNGVISPL
jgi:hypothetical protein